MSGNFRHGNITYRSVSDLTPVSWHNDSKYLYNDDTFQKYDFKIQDDEEVYNLYTIHTGCAWNGREVKNIRTGAFDGARRLGNMVRSLPIWGDFPGIIGIGDMGESVGRVMRNNLNYIAVDVQNPFTFATRNEGRGFRWRGFLTFRCHDDLPSSVSSVLQKQLLLLDSKSEISDTYPVYFGFEGDYIFRSLTTVNSSTCGDLAMWIDKWQKGEVTDERNDCTMALNMIGDKSYRFIVMPSATGKTTYAKKHGFIDVDDWITPFDDELKQKTGS